MSPLDARQLRHELGTQLNHIIGYAELLLDDAGPEASAGLEEIRDAGRQVLAAVDGLLANDRGGVEGVDLAALAGAITADLGRVVERVSALAAGAAGPDAEDLGRIEAAARRALDIAGNGPAQGAARPASPQEAGDPVAGHGVVLVVDDDAANRDVLVRWLARLGYGTLQAGDGREALELLATQAVDLVLLDLRMPGLDGFGVLERRKADPGLRDIPVVMISASGETESVARAIEMGAEDYLPKPFDPVLLRARVGACLEKKRLHDQERALVARISDQAAQLAEWNRTLEARVSEQVEQLERMARLRRFLSPQLADVIVSSGDESVLASHRRDIAVLFCDLRRFTAFAESAEPEDVIGVLGEFHHVLGDLVHRFEATVGFFAGDGLMVFFNDPLPCPDAAARAVRLAVAMREEMRPVIEGWRGQGFDLDFGVGIASGYATLGEIGFPGRRDYGVIGSVVNLAARLCAEAQPNQVLISERACRAAGGTVVAEQVGKLDLKGFHAPVPAWNVIGVNEP